MFHFSTRNHVELFVLYNSAHYFSAHFTLIYKFIKKTKTILGEYEMYVEIYKLNVC